MKKVKRAIILAAGRGDQLDGLNKALIKHPKTGLTILEHAIEAFSDKKITVVVGFRSVQVMQEYPKLNYVVNHNWEISNNALSLGMALTTEPTYVVAGDIFFDKSLIEDLDQQGPNVVLTDQRENRTLSAIHCILREDNSVLETYQGPIRDVMHPEAIGLFKISDKELIRRWKTLSVRHGNMFAGQTLPCDGTRVFSYQLKDHFYFEINTASDYLRLIEETIER